MSVEKEKWGLTLPPTKREGFDDGGVLDARDDPELSAVAAASFDVDCDGLSSCAQVIARCLSGVCGGRPVLAEQ